MTQQQKDFCMEVYRAAYSLYEENKAEAVSPRFTTAQAMLETGWGKSKIGNNIFGMTVGNSWTGRKKLVLTREVFSTPNKKFTYPERVVSVTKTASGYVYRCYRYFRDYDTLAECLRDHNALFRKKMYADAWPYRLYAKEFAKRIVDATGAKYATDPSYYSTMCKMIDLCNKIIDGRL